MGKVRKKAVEVLIYSTRIEDQVPLGEESLQTSVFEFQGPRFQETNCKDIGMSFLKAILARNSSARPIRSSVVSFGL